MTSFYEDFFGHFSESPPPTNVLVGDLIDLGGPPPPIPFGTRPVRGLPPPIHRSTRPPPPVPSPDPLPVFTPSLVSPAGFTATTDLAPMGSQTWQNMVGQISPTFSTSSTATSGFSIVRPGLEGRFPPIPRPFAGADPRQNVFMNQPEEPWYNQPLPADLNTRAVINALAHGQQRTDAVIQDMANLLRGLNHHVQNPPAPAPINIPAPQVIQAGGQVLPPAIKKYIANPDAFDGQSKHWKTFKNQINTFIQANSAALTTDEDKNWLVMSYLKEGSALEYAQLILQDVPNNIRNQSHTNFIGAMDHIFGDPSEKARAMTKLDKMQQGNQSLGEFTTDFEITYLLAGYNTTTHGEQLCQKYRTKLVYKLAERLTLTGASTTDYNQLRNKAFELDGFFQQWDFEKQSSHPNPNRGSCPQRTYIPQQASTSSTPAVKTSSGTTFGGSGQPMDIGKLKAENKCYQCGQPGHIKRNCPQLKQVQVRQVLDDMSEFDRAAVLEKYGKKDVGAGQDFQAPQQ